MNNAYLTSVATILVIGIPDKALELRIETCNSDNTQCYKTLKGIFLDNKWCCNIKPTETAGKILFITTKGDLDISRQWLNENLPALFTIHLPKICTSDPIQIIPLPNAKNLIMLLLCCRHIWIPSNKPYNPLQSPPKVTLANLQKNH